MGRAIDRDPTVLRTGRTANPSPRAAVVARIVVDGGHRDGVPTLDLYGHPFPDKLDELADRPDDAVRAPGVNQEPTDDPGYGDRQPETCRSRACTPP
jgi:hypothetical protein